MRVELAEFKRCCCCVPLRYGLLIWGYIKLVTSVLMTILLAVRLYLLSRALVASSTHPIFAAPLRLELAIMGVASIIILIDLALTVTFLVGCHKKNPRLLRVYNYYSIGMFVLYVLVLLAITVLTIMLSYDASPQATAFFLRTTIANGALNVGFSVYLILMTRSEILKLENKSRFQFVNNTIVECTMSQGTEAQATPAIQEVSKETRTGTLETESYINEDKEIKNGPYARMIE